MAGRHPPPDKQSRPSQPTTQSSPHDPPTRVLAPQIIVRNTYELLEMTSSTFSSVNTSNACGSKSDTAYNATTTTRSDPGMDICNETMFQSQSADMTGPICHAMSTFTISEDDTPMPSTPLIRGRDLDDMDTAEANSPYASATCELDSEDSTSECSTAPSSPRPFTTSLLLFSDNDVPFTAFEDHVSQPIGCAMTLKSPSREITSFWSSMDHLVKLDFNEILSPISFA